MFDLSIDLDMNSKKHLYQQIYEYIKNEMKKGKLIQGDKLPSTRSLAQFLQVSRSTVELSYEQLASEGYIESKPYKGYYISKIEDLFQMHSNIKKEQKIEQQPPINYLYDFSPNGVDMNQFPFSTWRKINKNLLQDEQKHLFTLGDPKGDLELRTTIGNYLHSSRGVNCMPEQIIIGAGNDYLLMLLRYLLGENRMIAMENPTYKRAYRIFQSFGYKVEGVSLDEGGIHIQELYKTNASVVYVMPSHQYPTGTVMPIGRRMELLKWAKEQQNRYIIEDDYDSEFRYKGKPIPALQASDSNHKVIYLGTFSKSIAPAIRVSYLVLPKPLLEIYESACHFFSSTVSRLDQSTLKEFMVNGHFERYLNKMRKVYRKKHDILMNELKELEQDFVITGENGGLHLLLTSKKRMTQQKLIEAANKHQVKVYGFQDSFIEETNEHKKEHYTVILGYATLSEEQMILGIKQLKKAWQK